MASLNFCTLPVGVFGRSSASTNTTRFGTLNLAKFSRHSVNTCFFGHDGTGCENDDDTADLAPAIVDQPDGEHLADVVVAGE